MVCLQHYRLFYLLGLRPHLIKFLGNRRTVGLAIVLSLISLIGIMHSYDKLITAISFILFLLHKFLFHLV